MATEHILRLERSDSPDDFVLINVCRSGKSELDLKLVATEGENPYVGSLKTSQISKLRAKNYRGSDEEWSGVLSYVFNQDRDAIKSEDWTTGLEVVATVKTVGNEDDEDSDKEIVITLRKRIDSIKQRLGSITLKQDDDQAIQLFDWTGVSVTRANDLAQEIFSLNAKYRDAENKINQLNSQLEELIQAKKEHDDQLIAKFALLLNEKKLKIRNQQRLLATAKVDPAKLAELEAANAGKKPRKPTASRHSKRKAQEEDEEEETDSDDAFDTMDIDAKENDAGNNQTKGLVEDGNEEDIETATESEGASTPQPLEDEETASEEDDPAPAPPKRGKGRAAAAEEQPDRPSDRPAARKPTASPPPRRELPFARRGGNVKSAPAFKPKPDENEVETESDEDL